MIKRWLISLITVIGIIAPVLAGSAPIEVRADTSPLDLNLGGEGATSWNVTNVKPGDSGTKMVTLHNAGSNNGFVTIWVSAIVSSEGTSPEFQTENTTEPGDLIDSLKLSLSGNGTGTNLNLPAVISNLPQSALDPKYIEVIPLKTGSTVNLVWAWELPPQTGNKAQGDGVSFTINYLLQECKITDVSGVVTGTGVFTENVTANSVSGNGEVAIEKDTTGLTESGDPINEIWIIAIDKEPVTLSPEKATLAIQYEAGPPGTTFDQPVTLTLAYNPDTLPTEAREGDLVIAQLDENTNSWVEIIGSNVNTVNNTVSVPVSHFSRYAVISQIPVPPPQGRPALGFPPSSPAPRTLQVGLGDGKTSVVEITADGTLKKSISLTDSSGNFILTLNKGTRVTGSDNKALSRLELTICEEQLVLPDNMVAISPVYKMVGYTQNMEVSHINFEPSAIITILYNPKNIPENAFTPFIANYTDVSSFDRLEPPPDSVFKTGKAEGVAHHASYFAVLAEVAPAPLPLPASFKVSNLKVNPLWARLGQPVSISVDIANEGDLTGSYELYLLIDGVVRAVKEVTIEPQSVMSLEFKVSNMAAGRHQIKVCELTGEFMIFSAAILPEIPLVDWPRIDLSVAAVLAASLLALYLVIRRSHQSQPR